MGRRREKRMEAKETSEAKGNGRKEEERAAEGEPEVEKKSFLLPLPVGRIVTAAFLLVSAVVVAVVVPSSISNCPCASFTTSDCPASRSASREAAAAPSERILPCHSDPKSP